MANSLPTFRCFKNGRFVGIVNARTEQQAHARAFGLYGRCEVMISATRKLEPRGRVRRADSSFTHGRSPYDVGDFEARRQAEIAKWKAAQ
jgi:hypothetical protein